MTISPSAVISEVDVKIMNGQYWPCKSCHWYNVCTVPQSNYLPKLKEFRGTNDIFYREVSANFGDIVYKCLEYTRYV